MNIKQIRELAQIVNENGLTALEITDGETHIRIGKELQMVAAAAPVAPVAAPVVEPAPIKDESGIDFNRATEIKASLIGVFYSAPSPDAEPYVKVGTKVKKGDVLCIIEAMKLMNEIAADRDGVVADICVGNGSIVEVGQVLFTLKDA